jgi:hypothetical protein
MGMRYDKPVPRPRKLGEVAETIVNVLHAERISNAEFFKHKHGIVRFVVGGWEIEHYFPCTPSSPSQDSKIHKRKITRKIEWARANAKPDGNLGRLPHDFHFSGGNGGI